MPVRGDARYLLALLLLQLSHARAADERPVCVVPGETRATASRIAEADRRIAEKKWADGLDELQAILDSSGDDLVPIDALHSLRARTLVHARIAKLPPDVIERYRDRVETQARRRLEEAIAARDATGLRKLVDDAFCSRPAGRALEVLGDIAFERGSFAEADAWWQLLVSSTTDSGQSGRLVYPGPLRDGARVRAKQIMAQYFQGQVDSRSRALDAFKTEHESAEGVLGGRKGKYVDFLRDLVAAPLPVEDREPPWTTVGGDAARSRVQPAPARFLERISVLCRGGPAWRISLPAFGPMDREVFSRDRIDQRADYSRSLAFHPLIAGDRLLIADSGRVMAFDLRHGGDSGVELYSIGFATRPPPRDMRTTLTVANGSIYARMGQPRVDEKATMAVNAEAKAFENRIVSIRLDPAPGKGRVRWVERGVTATSAKERGRVVFEGTPVARDGLVYVAATRFDAGKTVLAVHCYTAEPSTRPSGDEPPEPILQWHTDICEFREPSTARLRHHLLTLAGQLVVCGTDAGAFVALEASTGKPAWAAHYRARITSFDERPPLTDLKPCVFADGRLYAAPVDGDGIICLDADTGRTLWQRPGIDAVHLLGVGESRLILATPTGLRALDAVTGSDKDGWSRESRTAYGKDGAHVGWTPAGRGFLAGQYVLWPAVDTNGDAAVHALLQATGEADDNPTLLHRIPVGNLVYSEGCLAVAGRDELTVFVPPAWKLPEREHGARVAPASANAALALARAEADANLRERAAETYMQVERLAKGDRRLKRTASQERQSLWLDAGRQAIQEKRWADVKNAFARATDSEFPVSDRVSALSEVANALHNCERIDELADTLQKLCDSDELRECLLPDFTRAGDWHLSEVDTNRSIISVSDTNHSLSELQNRLADAALAAAKSPVELERLSRRLPHTFAALHALKMLAEKYERDGHAGAAAVAWRRRLALTESDALAFAGMARCYERQGITDAARSAWESLTRQMGNEIVDAIDPRRKLCDVAAEHLQALNAAPTSPSLPLRRTWDLLLDSAEEFLPTSGSDLFLTARNVEPAQVIAREVGSGRVRWRTKIPFIAKQAFCYADIFIIAGSEGIEAFRAEDGVRVWQFSASVENGPLCLNQFRLDRSHLCCLLGRRSLLLFDAGTGERKRVCPDISSPRSNLRLTTFLPHYVVTSTQIRAQAADGDTLVFTFKQNQLQRCPSGEPWSSDPVVFGELDTAIAVEGSRHVVSSSEVNCESSWSYLIPGVTTLAGKPPCVAVVGDALLLLVETNIGYQLQRLSGATGKAYWRMPVLLGEPVSDPADWVAADGAVCLVEGGMLTARSLLNGKRLWQAQLGDNGRPWRVERVTNGLLAYPAATTARQFAFRCPIGRLQWTVVPDAGEAVGGGFPLVCCDLNGQVVQRFNFASGATTLRRDAALFDGLSIVPRAAAWRGSAAGCLPVQVSPHGVVVVVGPHAWGLAPAAAK